MTENIIAFDFNGVNVILDSNTRLVRLTRVAAGTGSVSMHDTADNSNYQVPALMKANLIFIENYDGIGASSKIIYADDADGTTNEVDLFVPGSDEALTNFIFISADIPTGKFVNLDGGGSAMTGVTVVYAVEQLA